MKIELRRAAMTYQAPDGEVAALQDVTFGVADGEFVSIVGPSGCGKSTLLAVSGDISQIIRREHKTALLVTHDISEAISLSDRIVVLSHRPATVKAIHDLGALRTVPPLERRSRPEFQTLFNQIWEELDVNV